MIGIDRLGVAPVIVAAGVDALLLVANPDADPSPLCGLAWGEAAAPTPSATRISDSAPPDDMANAALARTLSLGRRPFGPRECAV